MLGRKNALYSYDVTDRRSVTWDPDHPLDPAAFRHKAQPGDFELESLQLEDVLVTVYQPGNFRPYTASIFRADMGTFRKQWAFYDFLRAENVVGQFDNCLFSLHRPQSIGRTTDQDLKDGKWSRMVSAFLSLPFSMTPDVTYLQSRFRMDGLNVDHLQSMTTQEGPFSWITSGKVDAVLDIKFPRDPSDELAFSAILDELADALTSVASPSMDRIPGQRELAKPPLSAPSDRDDVAGTEDTPHVIVDIDLRFRDLKAAVPLFTSDLSYVNNALIRPIVAFMNANRTLVPIRCRVVKDLEDFNGAWTVCIRSSCAVFLLADTSADVGNWPHRRYIHEGVRGDGVPRRSGKLPQTRQGRWCMEPPDDRERAHVDTADTHGPDDCAPARSL